LQDWRKIMGKTPEELKADLAAFEAWREARDKARAKARARLRLRLGLGIGIWLGLGLWLAIELGL
tara:strand:- start:220 stop:414 length:195 start_codon:yes stop_codon:yes gene_type:complete